MNRDNIRTTTRNNLLASIDEAVLAWIKMRKKESEITLPRIKSLEKIVEEVNMDLKESRKKNVFINEYQYYNHKDELIRTNNIGGLL